MKKLALILMTIFALFTFSACEKGYEDAPKITEGEFPFIVEYELCGEKYVISDTVCCTFDGYDKSNPFPFIDYSRTWYQKLKSGNEDKRLLIELPVNSESLITEGRINVASKVILFYGGGGYYLGDPNDIDREPCINYVEEYQSSENVSHVISTEMSFEQLEKLFGIKVTRFEFASPIENEFKEYND